MAWLLFAARLSSYHLQMNWIKDGWRDNKNDHITALIIKVAIVYNRIMITD